MERKCHSISFFVFDADAFLRLRGTRGLCEILSQNLLLGFVCMCKCSVSPEMFSEMFPIGVMHQMRHETSCSRSILEKKSSSSWTSSKTRWTKRCNVCADASCYLRQAANANHPSTRIVLKPRAPSYGILGMHFTAACLFYQCSAAGTMLVGGG